MDELEDLIVCTIKLDLTKMTINIYKPNLMIKMTQGFNEDMKSVMTLNNLDTPQKGIVRN